MNTVSTFRLAISTRSASLSQEYLRRVSVKSHLWTKRRLSTSTDSFNNGKSQAIEAIKTSYNVGFIGLGNMGLPMALNLTKDNELVSSILVYDTNHNTCINAKNQGLGKIVIAESIQEMFSTSADTDIIFTMLPSCEAMDNVMQKLLDGNVDKELDIILNDVSHPIREFPISIVDCSTVNPTTSRKWNKIWKEKCDYLMMDAPVSGGVKGAEMGTLTFMVGWDGYIIDRTPEQLALANLIEPLLYLMGSNILWCGSPGSGAATKLCNNLALAAQMVGICEAMNLGEKLGVDPIVLSQAINVSTAACWSSKVNNPHPLVATNMARQSNSGEGPPASRDYQGGFTTNLMMKDLKIALAAAEDCGGVALPLTAATKRLYQSVSTIGWGNKDFGVMLEYLKSLNSKEK
jgi:3-hydroxyisobutyrate dehydrogenase